MIPVMFRVKGKHGEIFCFKNTFRRILAAPRSFARITFNYVGISGQNEA